MVCVPRRVVRYLIVVDAKSKVSGRSSATVSVNSARNYGCLVSGGIAIWYGNDGADEDVAVTFPLDTVADGRVAGGVLPRRIWAGNTDPSHRRRCF